MSEKKKVAKKPEGYNEEQKPRTPEAKILFTTKGGANVYRIGGPPTY